MSQKLIFLLGGVILAVGLLLAVRIITFRPVVYTLPLSVTSTPELSPSPHPGLQVTSPVLNQSVSSPFSVTGFVAVSPSALGFHLRDTQGHLLNEGTFSASPSGQFSFSVSFPSPSTDYGVLDLSATGDSVTLLVKFVR